MFLLGTWCGVVCFLMSGDGSDGRKRRLEEVGRLGGINLHACVSACLRVCMSATFRRVGSSGRWRGGEVVGEDP